MFGKILNQKSVYNISKTLNTILLILTFLLSSSVTSVYAQNMQHKGTMMNKKQMMKKIRMLQKKAPAKGYLKAHAMLKNPLGLLGGPISINISQNGGTAYLALPDNRRIDPTVFGSPKMPRAFEGTPGITGLPPVARGVENGHYTKMKMKSPFGDKYITAGNARLTIKAVDATATDAAVTKDKLQFEASWKDKAGNTYTVKAKKLVTHGLESPTFGGVATNIILHGFTGLGTPLMPSEYTYFAFWAMGNIYKNGKLIDKMRIVHGMLTEYVRTKGFKLAFDDQVTPTAMHFHLMVPPLKPNMKTMAFDKSPVKTGFKLPNGMSLPFWHVMFEAIQVKAERE